MTSLLPVEADELSELYPMEDDITVWMPICDIAEIDLDRGVAASVDGHAIAVFRLAPMPGAAGEELYAVDHIDPRTGTPTIARGLVGSVGDAPTVAAPLYKERYDLRTGACLDDPTLSLGVHEVRLHRTTVEVRVNVTVRKSSGNTDSADS